MPSIHNGASGVPDRGELLRALRAFKGGDLSARMSLNVAGIDGEIVRAFNDVIEMTEALATELRHSQSLTVELQRRQEVLMETNDRLGQQVLNLQRSEAMLRSEHDELHTANEQLQDDANLLSEQLRRVELKNREVERAKAALEDKAAQLALSSQYKSEFIANMSHELRTPLNSLLILARLLTENADSNLTPKQIEFAKTIHSSGADLLSLIGEVLDLAKIESGTVTVNIGPVCLADSCDYVKRTFWAIAQEKELAFEVSIDPALSSVIETDGKRLEEILKNLLSNAFKFTTEGRVSLNVAPAASGWTEGHAVLGAARFAVAFSIADTGIGIPSDRQELIFGPFQQADGATNPQYGGTGLGLSISRELARLLGGEIKLVSGVGTGSTFTLYLPPSYRPVPERRHVNEAKEVMVAPTASAQWVAPGRSEVRPVPAEVITGVAGKKVLLVDDDVRNVFALTSALEQYGLVVAHAKNGIEALERLEGTPDFDLVLMDLMMPDLDGYDTIRIIRQLEGYQALPIIAVTAKAIADEEEKCLQAGASGYVSKPVNMDMLLTMIARCINHQGVGKRTQSGRPDGR